MSKRQSGFPGKFWSKAVHIWQDKETGAWKFSFRPIEKWTVNDLVVAMRTGTKELQKLQVKRRRKGGKPKEIDEESIEWGSDEDFEEEEDIQLDNVEEEE